MKHKKLLIICLFVVLLAIVAGVSFAIFNYSSTSSENTIASGKINFTYTEPSNSYVIDNALPQMIIQEKHKVIILNLQYQVMQQQMQMII